ncbi:Mismatch repair endonuclease PMS2 [Fasciola gigantica]|uniref:Mismatch repair endonuclease PMS2 n=1 Tax=Fasciola gigantica TaxID=46835 RepID=A0A504Z4G0_FASGI|nr:Mismatch repair endonuclease PMS2 [Fasciola gigantica]
MSERSISHLDKAIVNKICAGQVVVTLASAIKELLENSIDAEATKIDIRLKDYGCESIEVVDNGLGIEEAQFERITKKHCTSKLRSFEDLASVTTFGFRGEALFSLCQLAELIIHTCSADATYGTRLQFDANGCIAAKRPLARSRGTTVIVNRLFHNLPVRRKNLSEPAQMIKEFSKAVNVLTAYCLVAVNKQITCTRVGKSGEKVLVVSNGASTSLQDNIAAVFGQSQLNCLIPLLQVTTVQSDVLAEFGIKDPILDENIKLHGYISKPPGVEANVSIRPPGSRVSPKTDNAGHGRSSADRQFVFVNGRPCDMPKINRMVTDLWRRCSRETISLSSSGLRMPVQSTSSRYPVFVLCFQVPTDIVDVNLTPDKRTLLLQNQNQVLALTKAVLLQTLFRSNGVDLLSLTNKSFETDVSAIEIVNLPIDLLSPEVPKKRPFVFEPSVQASKKVPTENCLLQNNYSLVIPSTEEPRLVPIPSLAFEKSGYAENIDKFDYRDADGVGSAENPLELRPSVPLEFSFTKLKQSLSSVSIDLSTVCSTSSTSAFSLGNFRAEDSNAAEGELTTYFSKSSFHELEVVGQFNLGFIIGLHNQDLFIIDQHASDEKYRFEQLCADHRFVCQPLVVPRALDLSVGQEQLLLSNLDVFAKSGFAFHVDESAPCGRQVQLTATPMVGNKVFGRADVEEMLFVLAESCSRNCRPTRLRDILASRACRSAVMIGTALDHGKMRRIIRKMGTMEHPWNCPHGRPTMRHLFHLGRLGIGN